MESNEEFFQSYIESPGSAKPLHILLIHIGAYVPLKGNVQYPAHTTLKLPLCPPVGGIFQKTGSQAETLHNGNVPQPHAGDRHSW